MRLNELPTACAVVALNRLERNCARVEERVTSCEGCKDHEARERRAGRPSGSRERSRVLRPGVGLAIAVLVAGCIGPTLTPRPEEMRATTNIRIVAMEAPPLGVPPEFQVLVPGALAAAASPLLVYNSIAVLIEMPAASRRAAAASASFQAALDVGTTWMPTLVAAEETRVQLEAGGLDAKAEPGVRAIPGVHDRGHTVLMENWLRPIRAWYNASRPVLRSPAAAPVEPGSWVIEVGVLNYEITGGRLLLQVMMKLVDPATGAVIGRTREAVDPTKMPPIGPLDQAFSGDAQVFKRIVAGECRTLVRTCLARLGLAGQAAPGVR